MRRQVSLFFLAFFLYSVNLRPIPSGDTAPAALLPLTLVSSHTVTFDRFAAWYKATLHTRPAWFRRAKDGHFYSSFPIAVPLLITPLYAPFALLDVEHMPVEQVILLARVLEKLSASLIAALSVAAFWVLSERLAGPAAAPWLTAVYAFGSPTWSISSQALWQHGASEFAIILGLLCVIRETESPRRTLFAALAGFFAGFSVAIRLSNAGFCILMGGYALARWRPRQMALFCSCAVVPVAAVLTYNMRVFGSPLGSYPADWLMQGSALEGIVGMLFSPSRGLLVFCPVFLFSAVGGYLWLRAPKRPHAAIYGICLLTVVIHIVALAKYRLWWGGYSYGPRLLADIVPCLVILIIPAMALLQSSRAWRFALVATVVFSVCVQAIGAFCYPNGHWDDQPQSVDLHHERLWDWRDNQILRSAAAGPVTAPYHLVWNVVVDRQSLADALKENKVPLW